MLISSQLTVSTGIGVMWWPRIVASIGKRNMERAMQRRRIHNGGHVGRERAEQLKQLHAAAGDVRGRVLELQREIGVGACRCRSRSPTFAKPTLAAASMSLAR